MGRDLKSFMMCVQKVPQLRNAFISCKSLEETYDTFKIILGNCSYEEYEGFFKDLIKGKSILSEEDLLDVSGGISNFSKRALAPLALLTTFANTAVVPFMSGNSGSIVFAAGGETSLDFGKEGEEGQSTEETTENQAQEEDESYDTTDTEVAYGLAYLEHLPTDEKGLEAFLDLPPIAYEKDDEKGDKKFYRTETLKKKDGTTENITINEQKVYKDLEDIVKGIIKKVEDRTSLSKNKDRSENLRIAKAIYRWVAHNIFYDFDSIADNGARRKPQDALFVYKMGTGVCEGYANLAELMLRMAGIPSTCVGTIGERVDSSGHAFNAVYIEDDASNQAGWTLFDSTWASPSSGGNFMDMDQETKRFMEGECNLSYNIIEFYDLNISKKYYDELFFLFKSLKIFHRLDNLTSSEEIPTVLAKLNAEINKRLQMINKKHRVGLKFRSLEVAPKDGVSNQELIDSSLDLYDRFYVKYKTNLDLRHASKLAENYIFEMNAYESMNEKCLQLEQLNSSVHIKSANRVSSYINDVKRICDNKIEKYRITDFKSNLKKINKTIKKKLNKLNRKYKDIIVFKKFKFNTIGPNNTPVAQVSFKNVPDNECTQRLKEKDDFHVYFPAFYNTEKTLAENNESILRRSAHKIEDRFKIGKYEFILKGYETNAYIEISPSSVRDINVYIPEELLSFKIPFKIGERVKAFTLSENAKFDFSGAKDLRLLDVGDSTRYFWKEDGKLYERCDNNEVIEVNIPSNCAQARGIKNLNEFEISRVLSSLEYGIGLRRNMPVENFYIPYKFKVSIFDRAFVLRGNEKYDFSEAKNLRLLDAEDSDRYFWKEDGKLYEHLDGGGEAKVIIPSDCVRVRGIEGLSYEDKFHLLGKLEYDYNIRKDMPIENFYVPYKFKISSFDRAFTLSGNAKYDFSSAKNLRLLDVGNSTRYFWGEDGKLYERQDGGKDAVKVEIPEKCVQAKGIKELDDTQLRHLLRNLEEGYNYYEDVPIEKFCLVNE